MESAISKINKAPPNDFWEEKKNLVDIPAQMEFDEL